MFMMLTRPVSLKWRHNGRDSVSNHQPHDCLFNRLFKRRLKKISKPRVTGLCAGNSPVTDEFPAQMASNAEMFPFDDAIMFFLWHCSNPDGYWWNLQAFRQTVVKIMEWMSYHMPQKKYGCNYLSMPWSRLTHVSKMWPWSHFTLTYQ